MANEIERLEILIEANTRTAARAFDKLQKDTAKALGASTKSVKTLDSTIKTLASTVMKAASVLGVAFSGKQLSDFIGEASNFASELVDTADKIGITTAALQKLRFAGEQSGVEVSSLDDALAKFSKQIGDASRGGGDLYDILKANNVAIRDQAGNVRPLMDLFREYADLVKGAGSAQERNLLVTTAFGRSADEMGNMFRNGSKGIDEYAKALVKLGGVHDDAQLRRIEEMGDAWDAFTTGLTAWARDRAFDVIEAMDRIGKAAASLKQKLDESKPGKVQGEMAYERFRLREEARQSLRDQLAGRATDPDGSKADAMRSRFDTTFGAGTTVLPQKPNKETGGRGGGGGKSPEEKFKDMKFALEGQLEALTKTDREQAISNELTRLGAEASEQQRGAIAALTGKLYDQKQALEASRDATRFFAETAAEAFSSLIPQIETGNQVLDTMINKLIEAGTQALLLGEGPLANLFGGKSKSGGVGGLLGSLFGGFFADGGMLGAGKVGIAGENGPELVRGPAMISPMGRGGGEIVVRIISDVSPDLMQKVDVRSTTNAIRVVNANDRQNRRQQELSN